MPSCFVRPGLDPKLFDTGYKLQVFLKAFSEETKYEIKHQHKARVIITREFLEYGILKSLNSYVK